MTEEVGRGTVLAGRYRVVDPLPSDLDDVSVWRATDQILDRPVRVRVLQSGAVAPALDAARRAALVTDSRLVRVLDVGMHGGAGYVVSEQISGASLAQLVERGALTADQARAVVGEAAAALEVARRRGVHHLALRPSVVHVSADGRVLVSGLAIDAALLGTAQADSAATSRTDAVDLVRLLYTGLTGRWPAGPDDVRTTSVPAAPVLDGVPVPPGEIASGIPNDLDTLCSVTLGPHEDGPHSPGDVVHELEPWGEIRIGRAADDTAGRGGAVAAGAAAAVAGDEPERPAAPVRVARQSVRSAFDELPAGTPRPGTPPPAVPTRSPNGRVERTGVLPVGVAATPAGPATPPSPAALPPLVREPETDLWDDGGSFADDPFAFVEEEEETRRRFDPTALVLVLVGVAVLIGLVFAARSLFTSPVGDREPVAQQTTGQEPPETEAAAPPVAEEPAEEPPQAVPPTIASIRTFDPTDAAGERVENVELAVDGDPSTFWFSYTYNRPDFGGLKEGMGLELTFAEASTVSGVTLHVNGTGGNVEVRATNGGAPTEGPLLASSTLSQSTVLTFAEPVQTSTLVLYFTELPTNAAGQFRLEVTEITVS
ncbi:protein kinase family protein [Cellulomonas dongxiuzhuiae]|uniref:Protein kinase family protein n=1 Tax=Cellulomonas dongxiuzhuiae TaxID=2819979 RepID=A0ABX8GKE6_9CELL|nr:protein kinase family protein [Cellulomonas dongxiuzhuiae]MBO3095095.1 protein kinase family protein [Cellulomonas dongxiuzhuiae]QWC16106.1 protein kinase family protein [Cellulomonas dongxiuzhuiae]